MLAVLARGISRVFGDQNICMYFYGSVFPDAYSYQDLFPSQPVKYEDTILMGPNHPDAFLRSQYGDNYMNLPSKESRNHHGVVQYKVD